MAVKFLYLVIFGDPTDPLHLAIFRKKGLVYLTGKGKFGVIKDNTVIDVQMLVRKTKQWWEIWK